jgi:hypothetical protein
MPDKFQHNAATLISAAEDGQPVVLNTPFTNGAVSRALWVSVTGHVAVTLKSGTTLTFDNVPVGWFEVRCSQVNTAGTTATVQNAVW